MLNFAQRSVAFFEGLLGLAIGLSLMGMVEIAAAAPADITEAEMNLLPKYCPYTQTFKNGSPSYAPSPKASYWVAQMGGTFWAMHHYCWAQINMIRSRKAGVPAHERRQMWQSARGDYGYVIENAAPDFILLPEIYTRIGEVELLLNHPEKANNAFAQARQLKPDYWPAYSHWAEFLMKIGRIPEALKVVGSGLQYSPSAKVLLEQFRILGGKSSDIPKPVEKRQSFDASTAKVNPAIEDSPPVPDAKVDEK